jgi:Flp pilus assembly protein TadG
MSPQRLLPLGTDPKTKPFRCFTRIRARSMRTLPGLKRCLNCEGQSLVETAVCLALLFTLMFGIMETGLAMYFYNTVAEAAREGSRYAMVHGSSCSGCIATNASIQTYVQGLGYPGVNSSNLTVSTTWPDTGASCTPSLSPCNNPGNNVVVTATYQFSWNIPFVPLGTLPLKSTSEVVISQ